MNMTELKPVFSPDLYPVDSPVVIAGPCSAETEEQVLLTARGLAKAGIRIFRAGIWKPRTLPGCFEGVGTPGLEWMRKVKEETGMLTATEVATAHHTEEALEAGIDILWIGARTTSNPFAMQEIADTLVRLHRTDVPVLVKNPLSPDLDLWIGAMRRLYEAGIRHIGAVHRGFSSYGKQIYRNTPHWAIPTELRLRYPDIPIICDPSHIGGRRDFIAPLSQQALDMGFDGLIIESHCSPDNAWSDAAQQVTPEILSQILSSLHPRKETATTEPLDALRSDIDHIDSEIMELISRRMEVAREIGKYKKEHGMPVLQPSRYNDVMESRISQAPKMGIGTEAMRTIWLAIHDESVRQQIQLTRND